MTLRPRRLPALLPTRILRPRPPERRCSVPECRGWTVEPDEGWLAGRCVAHARRVELPTVEPREWWVWRGVGLPDAGPMSRAEMLAWRAE